MADPVRLPMFRGTAEHACCDECPFSAAGLPNKPVFSEYPEDPAFLVIGEGPGHTEIRLGRPFVGESGQVVNGLLARVGRPRDQVYVGNATLCIPPSGADVPMRERAAAACKPRLLAELRQFPGKPILTLGAVAARSVIPAATLAAIDPPDTPKGIKKAQKLRQEPTLKIAATRRKAIQKETKRQLKRLLDHQRKALITEAKAKHRRRPDEAYLVQEVARVQGKLEVRARELAIKAVDLKTKERAAKKLLDAAKPKKPKKPKPIKITDIVGTLFDVDVDGTGPRPLIPGIHPAALLRGGGATIGGSHTPDLAYVNLLFDASKINSLAKGVDIRLVFNMEHELANAERATRLFIEFYRDAIAEGAFSLDLETYVDEPDRHSALMAYVAKIRVIGLATKNRTISLAWELLSPGCRSMLQVLILRATATYHNGLYDRTVLMAHGFVMGERQHEDLWLGERWDDTLLAHHAAFPGNAHGLQVVASQFYGVGPWKSEFRNAEESPEKLAIYNASDTGATHALRAPLAAWVKRTNTDRVYALDRKMSTVASHMHLAGMPVDRETNEELVRTFTKNVVESRREVEDIARDPKLREQIWHYLAIAQARKQRKLDPKEFEARYQIRLDAMRLDPDWKWKIGAGKHIAALLQAMGVPLSQTTEAGDISTKKDVLEGLTDNAVVRQILTYRENEKLNSTFVYPIFDRFDATGHPLIYGFADPNNRIHPIWNIHRISGRWASSWPVVSNVPKDKWKKILDDAVLALGIIPPIEQRLCGTCLRPQFVNDKGKPTCTAKHDGAPGVFLVGDRTFRVNKDESISRQTRPNLRRQIRAPKGRKLVGFDFGQIEARVIALISGDPFLCTIFAEGRDPHIECARIVWPQFDSLDPDTRKQLREQIKPIEYGAMYLAQIETLHKQMLKEGNLIELKDLAKAYNKLMHAMAGVVRWQSTTVQQASQPPFEIADFVLGRRRSWPMGRVEATEACNFGVQTAASALMNQGMARMFPRLFKYQQAYAIAQIHDAAVFECWEDDADAIARDAKESFETEIERDGRRIPFPIEVKIGDTWAEV